MDLKDKKVFFLDCDGVIWRGHTPIEGASEMVAVENGLLVLGTWQGIFYCDFDGPRTRKLHIKLIPDAV